MMLAGRSWQFLRISGMAALRDLAGSLRNKGVNTNLRRTRRLVELFPGMITEISGDGARIMAHKENVR